MNDITQTVDFLKLKLYNEYLYQAHIYDEGDSQFHKEITSQVVKTYVDELNLPKDAKIVDLGCGPGYFLDEMKERGYTNVIGATLSPGDIEICRNKGHDIRLYDLSFLPVKDGYHDESVDFIFLRHALEHSPYPIFSLMEYNRVLKEKGKIYIEVPAPDGERQHELNPNHYSILGANQLGALLVRTGFTIDKFNTLEFDLTTAATENSEPKIYKERYYCIVATKARALDIR